MHKTLTNLHAAIRDACMQLMYLYVHAKHALKTSESED